MTLAISFVAFWGLVIATFASVDRRASLRSRARREWILDVGGLLIQGLVIPLAAAWLLAPLWRRLVPSLEGAVVVPGWLAFAVCFVGVDYLFYWNHRLLHSARLWPLHRVHHTLAVLDVLGTSRNTVWTSFLIVYVWATSIATYVLADPAPYLLAVALTAALDLWRHSPLELPAGLSRVLRGWLVLPQDHAWHHAGDADHGNYGANLMVWDRLHGTFRGRDEARPASIGIEPAGTLADELVRPWSIR